MRQRFASEQWLPYPRDLVFAFFANPANLPKLMPQWQRVRIDEVTFRSPPARPTGVPAYPGVAAGDGTQMLITARALPGLPLRGPWLARIEDFRWNQGFCDVQCSGPFAYWRHCHTVRDDASKGRPGTTVRDDVTFALPLWPLSRVGLGLVKASLRAGFAYRQERAAELLPAYARESGLEG